MPDIKTKPYGPLMVEHRIIEEGVKLMEGEAGRIGNGESPDAGLIRFLTDFFHTYADICHHGKEEDILFSRLKEKDMSGQHKDMMESLVQEHERSRENIGKLKHALEKHEQGDNDAAGEIQAILKKMAELYPEHIRKEDKEFFIPCMNYFSEEEQEDLVKAFREADRKLIHEKYRQDLKSIKARIGTA